MNPRPTDYESVALPLSYPGVSRTYATVTPSCARSCARSESFSRSGRASVFAISSRRCLGLKWLYRLVISCAQDGQRSQQRQEHDDLPVDEPAAAGGNAEESIYLMQTLAQLDRLGEGMKDSALLVHAEGLSHAEAGAVLGVSESTISWRLHIIRKQMSRQEAAADVMQGSRS